MSVRSIWNCLRRFTKTTLNVTPSVRLRKGKGRGVKDETRSPLTKYIYDRKTEGQSESIPLHERLSPTIFPSLPSHREENEWGRRRVLKPFGTIQEIVDLDDGT